jgi:transposase
MSPAYVQPYIKAQKNDERDAEAIAEAAAQVSNYRSSAAVPA